MIEITCLEDIAALRESVDIECKLAAGKDGKGLLPKDVKIPDKPILSEAKLQSYLGSKGH